MTKAKRISAFVLCVAVLCAALGAVSAGAAGYDFPEGAVPVSVKIDGKPVLQGEAVIINSVTYVPLRSFSELMGADSISWNAKNRHGNGQKGRSLDTSERRRYVRRRKRQIFLYGRKDTQYKRPPVRADKSDIERVQRKRNVERRYAHGRADVIKKDDNERR